MEPDGRILDTTDLGNGLKIYFYDRSRPIAGDRWQVQMLIHVPLKIEENYFTDCTDPKSAYKNFSAAFKGEIAYQQARIRNFVDAESVAPLLDAMKQDLLSCSTQYLSKPGFAERYILKRYVEWEKDQSCRQAQMRAIAAAEEQD